MRMGTISQREAGIVVIKSGAGRLYLESGNKAMNVRISDSLRFPEWTNSELYSYEGSRSLVLLPLFFCSYFEIQKIELKGVSGCAWVSVGARGACYARASVVILCVYGFLNGYVIVMVFQCVRELFVSTRGIYEFYGITNLKLQCNNEINELLLRIFLFKS